MSNDTTNEDYSPEDNEVIRELRAQLKTANANVKTAGRNAVALVERGTLAAGLMPEGFKGVADIFANEVDGEPNGCGVEGSQHHRTKRKRKKPVGLRTFRQSQT